MFVLKEIENQFKNLYLLTMSNRKDRQDAMEDQFLNINDNSKDFNINIHYGTSFPYNDIIAEAFNESGKGLFSKPNEYDCARNHYAIVKEAYDRGFDTCLIFEDDIQFYKNYDAWASALQNIPSDWDILQFGGFTMDNNILKYLTSSESIRWVKHKDVGVWNCSMYALSRKGMEYYIAFMNKLFWVADGPLYKAPLNDAIINTYISTYPLVIQADKDIVSSDIRTKENDTINYKNENMYESHIEANAYFEFKTQK